MRTIVGLIALAAGSAALTAWYVPGPASPELAVVADVGANGVARLSVPASDKSGAQPKDGASPPGNSRFFGYALEPVVQSVQPPLPTMAQHGKTAPTTSPTSPTTSTEGAAWTTDVVIYPGAREANADPVLVAPARVVTSAASAPSRDRPRHELVRDLQRELKRVGCYYGEIDGEWGLGSKRSMRTFMERVNSTLQSEDPDLIMLTLLRGYTGVACRTTPGPATGVMSAAIPPPAPVPARQPLPPSAPAFTAGQPSAVANGSIGSAPTLPARQPLPEGRMAVGGPMHTQTQPVDPAALTAPPVTAPAPRVQRPRPQAQLQPSQPRSANQTPRRERPWTANFFNQ